MTLPEIAIKRHVTTLMLLVSLVVLGGVALARLPLAFLPEVNYPFLHVNIPYENASPEQTERMIVRPLEDALGSLRGLKEMWSRCDQEGGNIRLEFDWDTDVSLARVEVWEKIDRIRRELPPDIGDIFVESYSNDEGTPILEGRLSSPRDLSESWDLLERRILKPLERVPGVAQVRLDGVQPREVRVNLSAARLEAHRVDVRSALRVLQRSNFDMSLGRITEGDLRYSLRTAGTFADVDEIRNLALRPDGLRLGDVAEVTYEEPPLVYGRHLDGQFAIAVTVTQEGGANTVNVCQALEKRIAEMSTDPELEGVNFLVWFSQGREIRKTLDDLSFSGLFGGILAALVLYLFLRRFSSTLVTLLAIPFSLIVTCGITWARGGTLNTLTLLGLIVCVGMLVDNAVVVMENIFRHQQARESRMESANVGAREVSLAVTAATLTSVIVFLPLIYNRPSEMNIYLRELGITVSIALLASLFISQTLIPLATSRLIQAKPVPRLRTMVWLEERYVGALRHLLHRRWLAPVIGTAVVGSAIFPVIKVDKNFDATESELFVQVNYDFGEDLGLKEKEAVVTRLEAIVEPYRKEFHVRSIYSFWSTDSWTFTRVYLREGDASQKNIAHVRRRLKEILPEVPGLKLEVQENWQSWRRDRGKRIAFQIVGEDSELLGEYAEEAKRQLEGIPGLFETFASSEEGGRELHVQLDSEVAWRLGISPRQPADVVGLTFRGQRLRRFRTTDGEREMRMTLDEREQESVSQLHNLPLWTAGGARIPLASVADFREVQGAESINRDNRLTSVWVGGRYEDGTREQYLPAVTAVAEGLNLPYGYSWTFGRWEQRHKEKSQEFLTNLLLALLLVFAVMAGLFESVRQAITLLVALPFAAAGAFWALYLTRTDFDSPAAVGLLLLIGIVVNNGIVMIEHMNMYRRRGMPREEAIVLGGRERLRPVLMTALTTLLGLVPIAVQRPSLGDVYYYSMAFVIMGGLFISTFLTTLLLPTSVTLVEDAHASLKRAAGFPGALARRARLARLALRRRVGATPAS